jgi:hypothetical protein
MSKAWKPSAESFVRKIKYPPVPWIESYPVTNMNERVTVTI